MKRVLIAALLLGPVACSDSSDSKKESTDDQPVAIQSPTPTPTPTPTATATPDPTPAEPTPTEPVPETPTAKELTIDATVSKVWVYHGLKDGELVPMKKEDPWIIGTSRYMWATNSGSSKNATTTTGGAYALPASDFDAIKTCDAAALKTDVILAQVYSVNEEITTKWANTLEAKTDPLDVNFVVVRDGECIKLRVLSYDPVNKGLYKVKYERLK